METRNEGESDTGEFEQEEQSVQESLGLTSIMCASKSCPAPRYHLTCSGVPKGSQIFRNAIVSCQIAEDEAVATSKGASRKYGLKDGKQSKNWPTSTLSFMCPSCDVEGTSRYLLEYFERFHSMKKSFYAEYLRGSNNDDMDCRLARADESVEARTGEAFLWHLMKDNRKEQVKKRHAEGKDGILHWNPSEIQLKHMAKVLAFLSKQLQQEQIQQHQRRQKRQKNKFQLDPSYLVGMPIRLFNPIDNSYHSGRVLDYKANAPYQVDQPVSNLKSSSSSPDTSSAPDIGQLTDDKICSTLFLIRFRQGVEGRKIAVHEWIYLEEHAVSIGGEICWAQVGHHSGDAKASSTDEKDSDYCKPRDSGSGTHVLKSDARLQAQKGEYLSQYRPVQIIFRTMLEMIPVQNLNPLISCAESKEACTSTRGEGNPRLNVLAMGFGQAFSHVRLSLGGCGMRPVKETQLQVAKNRGSEKGRTTTPNPITATTTAEPTRPTAIPLASSNPSWIDQTLHRAQLSDEDVALGLAMACMEKEEERRVRTWRHLSVSHLFQSSFSKTNYEISIAAKPSTTSSMKLKNRRTQSSSPSTHSPSSSNRMDLNHEVSLELAASLGCSKCMNESKTGMKTHRSHKENCPRRRNVHLVSLKVGASHGCAKCMKEIKTGIKSHRCHDENCPRRRPAIMSRADLLNEEDDDGSTSIKLSSTADNFPSSCSKLIPALDDNKPKSKKQKVASSTTSKTESTMKKLRQHVRAPGPHPY